MTVSVTVTLSETRECVQGEEGTLQQKSELQCESHESHLYLDDMVVRLISSIMVGCRVRDALGEIERSCEGRVAVAKI